MKRILFEDDFEGNSLKPTWRHRGHGVISEVGGSTSSRSTWVSDGSVHLTSVPVNGSFAHASIGTGEVRQDCDFIISKGFVEAKVKFNSFHGAHGAVWLAPATDYEPGQAEIDFGEYFGAHRPNRKSGTPLLQNAYWREPLQIAGEFTEESIKINSADFGKRWDDWNRFKVQIAEDRFTFWINGTITGVIEGVFPIKPKFLCISMLTKFQFEADAMKHNHDLPEMSVDWIRAWDFI